MSSKTEDRHKSRSICIIGAGPGGMSMAWFLKKAGYTNVTVLEKRDRVGGMCDSITYGEYSFDLGANYVTSDYKNVRKLAREVGAKLETDTAFQNQVSLNVDDGKVTPTTSVVNAGHSYLSFGIAALRYFWYQFKYRRIISQPNLTGMNRYPDLRMSFGEFLTKNGMTPLWKLLMLPITAMGYGHFNDLPAMYGLRYINSSRFFSMLLTGLHIPQRWPKRFCDGFQRLWQRVAWGLDVRLGVEVESVERGEDGVDVRYLDAKRQAHHEHFDTLVLACPFTVALDFLDASLLEQRLFSPDVIQYNDFHNTSALTEDFPYQVVNELMLPSLTQSVPGGGDFPKNDGHPWIFGKQEVNSKITLFYSSVAAGTPTEEVKEKIRSDCELAFKAGGKGRFLGFHTSRVWDRYFPHVSTDDLFDFDDSGQGYYDLFESMQGTNNTFYVGGLLSFELVECIMAYTRHLVDTRF